MSDDQLLGLGLVAGMVAAPFVGAWVERLRAERRWRAGRVSRMVAAAERDGRRA